ncbi:hypothetical protein SETIT_4G230200v2 [Setaria italica]|uniref:Uncharacterized protein n=2 Tax=Setaria TaxID=4554 RepID=K3Y0B4_SETIT|nr:hypothetical protein SETIT_4G230200v2 [Setaria italica]TKW22637.1 hypothetical protein SEVIR_4G241600v2 [Setaria viridis]
MVPDNSSGGDRLAKPAANPQPRDDQQVTPEEVADMTTSTSDGNCFHWLWNLIKTRITGASQHYSPLHDPRFRPINDPLDPVQGLAASERGSRACCF